MSVARPVGWFLVCHFWHEGRRDRGSRLPPMWVTPIPFRSIATCNHSVLCMFTHHVFPSGKCHLQSHGWFSYGGRWQPIYVWGLLPIRGSSRPPSDLLTRHCAWPRVPGCVLSSFPNTTAVRTPVPGSDPSAFLCAGRCTGPGYCARGHQRLQLPRWRLARRLLQRCTTMGGLQNK